MCPGAGISHSLGSTLKSDNKQCSHLGWDECNISHVPDVPEVRLEQSWTPSGDTFEVLLQCAVTAFPSPKVSVWSVELSSQALTIITRFYLLMKPTIYTMLTYFKHFFFLAKFASFAKRNASGPTNYTTHRVKTF